MRRSDEEFKTELMLRVKKHRAALRRRKKAWITVSTAAVSLVIVTAVKMSGIFGMSTEAVRETAPGRAETAVLEEVSESGEIHTEIARDVVETVTEGYGNGSGDGDEYYYAGVTEPAVIDGMEPESLQVLSVRVESGENGSTEYRNPAVAGQLLAFLQSFQSAEETHATAQTETKEETQAETKTETRAETKATPQTEPEAETQAEAKTETGAETKAELQTEPRAETQVAPGTAAETDDRTERESLAASTENESTDSEKATYTVIVQYADGSEYRYTLQRGTDFWIILGEDNAQMSLTAEQWERLNALLKDISAEGEKS